jgi:signal transduction histidine kinase
VPTVATPWRVVLLHNADFFLPASTIMDQALREELVNRAPRQIDFYGETLDLLRYPESTQGELLALLRKKHATHTVDLVMARGQGGLDFALKHGPELWPGTPIVFYNNVGDRYPAGSHPLPGVTGVLIDLDPAGTLDLIVRLHPDARHLFIVGGRAPYDLAWKKRVQAILAERKDLPPATWLDDLPLPELLDTVGRLPADSVVLYTSMVRDATGQDRVNPQVSGLVAQAANAPVYGFLDTYIGRGIVGGDVPHFAAQGREAAKLALRILRGESASSIPVQQSPDAQCVVDARVLERWHIDEARLPPGCDVRFREFSVWRAYRWYIVGAVLAIALQSLLIVGLLVQWQRRRVAEREARRRSAELAHASRLAVAGELAASISHEINQPLGAILANTGAADKLLSRAPADLEEFKRIVADIRRQDLRASEVVQRVRAFVSGRELEKQPGDINGIAVETLDLLGHEAKHRGVRLDAALSPSLGPVIVDRIQLSQVLINLCINGMDAMANTPAEHRVLTIQTRARGDDAVEIAVFDRGHGIAADALPRLFDSFFTTKPQGMGLGLSIARSIVDAHDGTIAAENVAEGGAVVRITLPRSPGSVPQGSAETEATHDTPA